MYTSCYRLVLGHVDSPNVSPAADEAMPPANGDGEKVTLDSDAVNDAVVGVVNGCQMTRSGRERGRTKWMSSETREPMYGSYLFLHRLSC